MGGGCRETYQITRNWRATFRWRTWRWNKRIWFEDNFAWMVCALVGHRPYNTSTIYEKPEHACLRCHHWLRHLDPTDWQPSPEVDARAHCGDGDSALGELSRSPEPGGWQPPMDKHKTGLYQKFVVERTDGTSAPGQKHDGCHYFVLDLTHDLHAIPALAAYADSCATDFPLLAHDLREIVAGNRLMSTRTELPLPPIGDPSQ